MLPKLVIFSFILLICIKNSHNFRPENVQNFELTQSQNDFISNSLIPFYLREKLNTPLPKDIDTKCRYHLEAWSIELWGFILNPLNSSTWAIQMLDSWGKIPEGILQGHVKSIGDFDECIGINELDFFGKYCNVFLLPNELPQGSNNSQKRAVSVPEFLQLMMDPNPPLLIPSLGICIPSTCSNLDVNFYMRFLLQDLQNLINPQTISCYTQEKKPLDAGAISMISLMTTVVGFCIISTFYDLFQMRNSSDKEPEKSQIVQIILSFSLWTNLQKLLSTKSNGQDFSCLHGLRFLTMCWVVLGHSFSQYNGIHTVWNIIDIKKVYEQPWTMSVILNASLSVDTFFTIGGFLVSYNILKALDKGKGRLNIPLLYLHRYLRITPILAFIVGFTATLLPYMTTGPRADILDFLANSCRKVWWHNLIYANNLIELNFDENMCVEGSWFLANDMQFFVLSPLVIYPLWKWEKFGQIFIGILSLISVIIPAILIERFDLLPTALPARNSLEYHVKIYIKPWARFGPYVIGIWVGFLLWKVKKEDFLKFSRFVKKFSPVFWLLCTGTALGIIFGTYEWINPKDEILIVESMVYGGLHRTLWGCVIGWIIYACCTGCSGGFVNKFLSWKPFIPLGRLAFTAFLVSILVQVTISVYNSRQANYFNVYKTVAEFTSQLFLSLFVALICTLTIESPFMQLEKIIFGRFK